MGRTVASLHFRGLAVERGLELAAGVAREAGWRETSEDAPKAEPIDAVIAGAWTSVQLPRHFFSPLVSRVIAASEAPGIYLFTADSDVWGATLFRGGSVVRRFDSQGRAPGARTLARTLREMFGFEIPTARLAEALAARPIHAEEAMDAFARLLGITTALDVPDEGVTRVALAPPLDGGEIETATSLDVRAQATVIAPPPGFGTAVVELLRMLADEVGGGRLGPRNIVVEGATVTRFTERDLPSIAARLDAGGIASLDADFGTTSFSCQRLGSRGRHVQIVFRELVAADGRASRSEVALLAPSGPLVPRLYVATGAHFGLIEPVPSDPRRAQSALVGLTAWPPLAHWTTYLGPRLVEQLGGASAIAAAASGCESIPLSSGGLLIRIPVAIERARGPEAEPARRALGAILAKAPPV